MNLSDCAANPKKLLFLGGNRSNVPSIRSARRAGYFVLLAVPHPDSAALREADVPLLIDVRDCERLLTIVGERGGIDGVVSLSEAGVEPAAYISARLGLPSISEAAAANARSKAAMRQLWAQTGYSTEFAVVVTEQEASEAVDRLGLPLIFKPDRSFGGSRGVSRVERAEQAVAAFHFATGSGLPGTGVVIERCVTGTEHSCEVLIHDGVSSVLCIGQKVKSPPPYRVDVSVQYPAPFSREQEEAVIHMCRAAVAALGLTRGAAHVEFAYTTAGPVLFELGARSGGGHTPEVAYAVSGVEELIEVCRLASGDPPAQLYPIQRRGGDYRFLIFPPGRVRGVDVPAEVRAHPGILDVEVMVKAGSEIHAIQSTSDRAGFVVTRGRDRAEAAELADWACRQIAITYDDGSVSTAMTLDAFTEVGVER